MPASTLKAKITSILLNKYGSEFVDALTTLRDRAPLEVLDVIISLLSSSSEQALRRRAGGSLPWFRDHIETRTDVLIEHLLHNSDQRVRLSCAIALMSASAESVTVAYRRALEDPFDRVVQIACVEVGARGEPEALMSTLHHASWRVRLEACKALITQGKVDQRVLTALEKLSQEPEARIYDAECDESDEHKVIIQGAAKELFGEELAQGLGEAPRWGKLDTIIAKARSSFESGRTAEPNAPRNGGPVTQLGNSGASEGPPAVS